MSFLEKTIGNVKKEDTIENDLYFQSIIFNIRDIKNRYGNNDQKLFSEMYPKLLKQNNLTKDIERDCLSYFARVNQLSKEELLVILDTFVKVRENDLSQVNNIDHVIRNLDDCLFIEAGAGALRNHLENVGQVYKSLNKMFITINDFLTDHPKATLKEIRDFIYKEIKTYLRIHRTNSCEMLAGNDLYRTINTLNIKVFPSLDLMTPKSMIGWQEGDDKIHWFTDGTKRVLDSRIDNCKKVQSLALSTEMDNVFEPEIKYSIPDKFLSINSIFNDISFQNKFIQSTLSDIDTNLNILYIHLKGLKRRSDKSIWEVLSPVFKVLDTILPMYNRSSSRDFAFIDLYSTICYERQRTVSSAKRETWIDQARKVFNQ